jgi:hypothetical protein
MHRLQSLAALAIIATGISGATSTQANMVVGNVILIQQDVEGGFNNQDWTQTSKGDDVFEAEFIRTQLNSKANFALLDGTTIGLGATAIMKIDHVVFDPHTHSIQKLIVSAKEGAVRWISGNSISGAYQIDTPHAVITDEGTAFDLVVEPQRTLVLLHTGRVTACAIHAPGHCKTLSRRGEMALATTEDVVGPWESGVEPLGFETQCLNAKCTIAAFAPPPSQPPLDGNRKPLERLPEPHHAVAPSPPDTREAHVPISVPSPVPLQQQPPSIGLPLPPIVIGVHHSYGPPPPSDGCVANYRCGHGVRPPQNTPPNTTGVRPPQTTPPITTGVRPPQTTPPITTGVRPPRITPPITTGGLRLPPIGGGRLPTVIGTGFGRPSAIR